MLLERQITNVGRSALEAVRISIGLVKTFGLTLRGSLRRGSRPKGEVVQQMYLIGNKSVLFIAVTMGFVGMVMVYQSCLQLSRVVGQELSQVGAEFLKLLVQDFGPSITALMLATRVGAGIAAEVGSMKVTEQVDALRMSGVTPIDYLIVPRFMAAVVMVIIMSVFGVGFAFAAGGFTAWSSFNVNPRVFFDVSHVGWLDVALGFSKALAYGMAIPIVSGFCGLDARGSSEGVGKATTAAVIGSSLAVIVIGFIISGIGLFLIKAGLG